MILLSQKFNFGTPLIQNFNPIVYHAEPQSWDIEIGIDGTLYVANNDGLLRFDGEKWQSYVQPNGTIGRSLALGNNSTIHFGGQDEIGYWRLDDKGKLTYQDCLSLIPENQRDLEDIWQIKVQDTTVVFRSRSGVHAIQKEQFRQIAGGNTCKFLAQVDSLFYYNDFGKGIYELNVALEKQFLIGSEILAGKAVIDMLKLKTNELLILTEQNGLYIYKNNQLKKWESNASAFLQEAQIISACLLRNGTIAIGTRLGGLLLMDEKGRVIYKIDKKVGLQNNSITSIAEDAWGNLWLATYYGIDKVSLSASMNFFYPDEALEGAVFDIELWEGQWWFGTTNGLYRLPYQDYYHPLEEKSFQYVEGSAGQVWSMDIVNGQLYMGHNNGAFKVYSNGTLGRIGDFIGGWKFVELTPNKMAIGTYDGVQIFKKEQSDWVLDYVIEGFYESARIIIKDIKDNLWVSHPYRGVFKIQFDAAFEKYNIEQYPPESGFDEANKNYVFSVFDTPYITNDSGIYRYDFGNDCFAKDSLLMNLLNDSGTVQRIINKNNKLWYVTDQETGLITDKKVGFSEEYSLTRFPNLSDLYVAGFENLYPEDTKNQLLCTNKGVLYHYVNEQEGAHPLKASVDALKLTKTDSLIYVQDSSESIQLASHENAIEFSFRTNGKVSSELEGYSYKLEGLGSAWSTYTPKAFKEYTNLDYGTYAFLLKAKDNNGTESAIYRIAIEIAPPWYLTHMALAVYAMLFMLGISALLLIPRQKYKENTAILMTKQRETEKAMKAIQQEKLQNEIRFKNKELASSTLQLLQKNQTLNSLRTQVERLRKQTKNTDLRKELNDMVSILRSDLRLEEDWDRFSIHFDQVHHDFIKRLKTEYPQLSTKDHKLCAYLKMNLSTKEIAPLLNISVRGVEISRYRLRKKLVLDKSVNLNVFMNKVSDG